MTDRRNSYPNGPRAAYRDKLLDPRWQKKRLAILERDDWACQGCGTDEETLHVHHRIYSDGDPWDTPDEALVTLCAICHDEESRMRAEVNRRVMDALRLRFLLTDIGEVMFALEALPPPGMNAFRLAMALGRAIREVGESDSWRRTRNQETPER